MIPTSVDTLYSVAAALLSEANQALIDNALTPPANQFVSWNAPAWDCCDHLTVHVGKVKSTASSMPEGVCAARFEAEFVVTLIGCAPVGDPTPTNADMEVNAHGFLQRAWVLYQTLACEHFAGTLLPAPFANCNITKLGELTPHGPMGGCGSVTISLTVQLS